MPWPAKLVECTDCDTGTKAASRALTMSRRLCSHHHSRTAWVGYPRLLEQNGHRTAQSRFDVAVAPGNCSLQTAKEEDVLAIAGTGYGVIGILVIILLVVLILYFVRRA